MATTKPARAKPARKKPAPLEAYYHTPAFAEATGDGEELTQIRFYAAEHARACGMDPNTQESASDRILDWNFRDPFWKEATKIKIPRELRVLVPFGKYARDPDDGFAIYDYRCLKKESTLLGLIQFCHEKVCDNSEKLVDGQFFEGFSIYPNGLWVLWLQA